MMIRRGALNFFLFRAGPPSKWCEYGIELGSHSASRNGGTLIGESDAALSFVVALGRGVHHRFVDLEFFVYTFPALPSVF
jgi:hypothetical protein